MNELKIYMQKKKLLNTFSTMFCEFIEKERRGIAVPREKIRESIEFFESTFFDYDAEIGKRGEKINIFKKYNMDTKMSRHSTADQFFEANIMDKLLGDCEKFYRNFVEEKCLKMPASE